MADEKEENFTEEDVVKTPFAKWDKVGKSYIGVFVQREIVPNNLPGKEGTNQAIYYLADAVEKYVDQPSTPIEGGVLKISGRGVRNPSVIPQLETCHPGHLVKIEYTEEMKSKRAGFSGAKILKVYRKKDMHPEVVAKFKGEVFDERDELASPEDVIA